MSPDPSLGSVAPAEQLARSRPQTIAWAPWVYGEAGVPLDDPAESFHEASKVHPSSIDVRLKGAQMLDAHPELSVSAARAVRRRPHLPSVPLPPPALPETTVRAAVEARESTRDFGRESISVEQLASLLHAAYGVTHASAPRLQPMRSVPSGGALYPLELYPAVLDVGGLMPALYHFDPLRRVLERVREADVRAELQRLTVYPEVFVDAAVVVFMTAVFWRTRFKYGLRGYRFALLEAGHVAQNVLLTATAFGLASVPVGGFYDREVDRFLGADGVDESALYAVSVGTARAPAE